MTFELVLVDSIELFQVVREEALSCELAGRMCPGTGFGCGVHGNVSPLQLAGSYWGHAEELGHWEGSCCGFLSL